VERSKRPITLYYWRQENISLPLPLPFHCLKMNLIIFLKKTKRESGTITFI
jgi:hypothetical protein